MDGWMASAVRDAERSNAKRSTARARDTCTTHTHNAAVRNTLLWTRNCARTARCVHGLHCTKCCVQPCCFCLEFLLCCVSRDPGGSLLLFSTQRTGCSRRIFPSKRRLFRRLESCAKLARLVDWISLGCWLRMWRMSQLIRNRRLYLRMLGGTYRIYRYSYRLFCFLFARIFLFSPASSLLLRLWSFRLRLSRLRPVMRCRLGKQLRNASGHGKWKSERRREQPKWWTRWSLVEKYWEMQEVRWWSRWLCGVRFRMDFPRARRGRREVRTVSTIFPQLLRVPKHLIFTDFLKISKVAESRQVENLRAERSSNAQNPQS